MKLYCLSLVSDNESTRFTKHSSNKDTITSKMILKIEQNVIKYIVSSDSLYTRARIIISTDLTALVSDIPPSVSMYLTKMLV